MAGLFENSRKTGEAGPEGERGRLAPRGKQGPGWQGPAGHGKELGSYS